MITFKQFIAESLNSPYDYKVQQDSHVEVLDFIDENGTKYKARFIKHDDNTMIEIMFSAMSPHGASIFNITSTGSNAFRVYSTIGAHLKKMLTRMPKLRLIKFESFDPRTIRVYGMMMRRIAREIKASDFEQNGQEFLIWP